MTGAVEVLKAYGRFEESIVLDVRFVGSTFVLEISLDATSSLEHAGKSAESGTVTLTFVGVEEVHVTNDFPRTITQPSQIGWSHNEIAVAEHDRPDLPGHADGTHWMSLRWERDQRIDVRYRSLRIGPYVRE